MSRKLADLLCMLLVALPVLLTVWLWPALPDPMPSHWNAAGEVDGTMPKFWGVAVLPLAAIACWLLLKVVPLISPRGFRTDSFAGALQVFQVALVGFLSLVAVLVLLAAIGVDVRMDRLVAAATGLLFIVIGGLLHKLRTNFFIGIRTPWTLADDEVWARTHRLGGWLFMLAGAVLLVGGASGLPLLWLVALVLLCCLYPVLYSYLLYRRIVGFGRNGGGEAD